MAVGNCALNSLKEGWMKRFLMILLAGFPLWMFAQNQKEIPGQDTALLDKHILMGRWRSRQDSNWVMVFYDRKAVSLMNRDKSATIVFNYYLSRTCLLRDSLSRFDFSRDVYLLFENPDNQVLSQCTMIENMGPNVLRYSKVSDGRVYIFDRIQ
jgi:hypothetical protein